MSKPVSYNVKSVFNVAVLVAALGYFVDIYDLLLFSIIRKPSLASFGLNEQMITEQGENILMWQMIGLLLGGILWGVMGDKKGRLSVLFGSILLYSLANIANGFVQTVEQYKWVRFIAGLGLAGELGAGITLVSELVAKEKRGIATSLVAGIGLTGAIVAFLFKQLFFWRTCFFIGGGMGLLLLFLRVSVFESGMYQQVRNTGIARGNFFALFTNANRIRRYLLNIFIGLPTWAVIGLLITFSGEFGKQMGIEDPIDSGKSVMYAYVLISIGDLLIGFISQWFQSRKKALWLFYGLTIFFIAIYFTCLWNGTAQRMYWVCAGLGLGTGFWAIFVTMAAEQFGTNLRATATTTIPNMVRGMLAVFILPLFKYFKTITDYVHAGLYTVIIVMVLSLVALVFIQETFGKDLDFIEK